MIASRLKQIVVTAILVSLYSCTQLSNNIIPTKPKIVGSLEVQFNEQGTAKANFVMHGQPLSSNTLRNVSENTIGIDRTNAGTFDDANGIHHFWVTFKITNLTGGNSGIPAQTFQNLTFYAFNQQKNSLGGTALKGLRNFNQDPIANPQIAQSVQPEHGTNLNGIQLKVDPNRADFQAFRSSEAQVVETDALAEGTINAGDQVLEYGFVARNQTGGRSIPPQQTGFVTIAVKVPAPSGNLENPSYMVWTAVLVDESVTRVTRSPEETTTEVEARAANPALNASEVVLLGSDTDTVSVPRATVRLADIKTATAPVCLITHNANAISGLNVTTPQTTLTSGTTTTLTANIEGGSDCHSGVNWSLQGTGSLSTLIGSSTIFTAPNVASPTDVYVRAESVLNPNQFLLTKLTVDPKPPIAVSITPKNPEVKFGQKITLTATVNNANLQDVTWTTSSGTITPTAPDGATAELTAPVVNTDTNITVTATSKEDSTKSGSTTITVRAPKLEMKALLPDFRYVDPEGYAINGNTINVPLGGIFHIQVYKDGTAVNTPVTFSVTDSNKVLLYGTDGKAFALFGGIVANSSAIITAQVDGLTSTFNVNVGVVQLMKNTSFSSHYRGVTTIRPDGVYGYGLANALGLGSNFVYSNQNIDPPVRLPLNVNPVGLAGGYTHNLILADTGVVYSAGNEENDSDSKLIQPNWTNTGISNIDVIASKFMTDYYITRDAGRHVYSRGANNKGQACRGTVNNGPVGYGDTGASGVNRLGVGRQQVAAVTADGGVWTCGENDQYQLGLGNNTNPVPGFTRSSFPPSIQCSGTEQITVCINTKHQLVVAGRQPLGQFGLGNVNTITTPTVSPVPDGVLDAQCSKDYCAVLSWNGSVYVAGGALNAFNIPTTSTWTKVASLSHIVQIVMAEYTGLFVRDDQDRYYKASATPQQLSFAPGNISVSLDQSTVTFRPGEAPVVIATVQGSSFSAVEFTSENPAIAEPEKTYVAGHQDSAIRVIWKSAGTTRFVARSLLGGTPAYLTVHTVTNQPPQIKRFYVNPAGPFDFDASLNFNVEITDPEGNAMQCRISRYDNGQLNWVFPDNNGFTPCSDSTFHPSHKVTWTNGDRTYKLEVTDGTTTVSQDLVIGLKGNASPVISSFTPSSTFGTAPLSTTFNWSVSDPNGDFITCQLDLDGDGVYEFTNPCSSYTSQAKTYASSGTYNAKLKVTDIRGGVTEATKTITVGVVPPPNQNPVISSFTATPSSGTAPITVDFAYTVSDPNNDALNCSLDANGDGITDQTITNCTTGSFSQAFSSNGTYNAKLQVVDGRGGVVEKIQILNFITGGIGGGSPGNTLPFKTSSQVCWFKAGDSINSSGTTTPFLYLPFNSNFTADSWTSQFDHSSPNYSKDGHYSTLGESMDDFSTIINGYNSNKIGKSYPIGTPINTIVNEGFKFLYYTSPSFEIAFGYEGHDGHDFAFADKAVKAVSAGKGTVIYAQINPSTLGRVVIIYHELEGYLTLYAHLASFDVQKGNSVMPGDSLGTIGGSAYINGELKDGYWGTHLHFGVYHWNTSKNEWELTDPFGWDPWSNLDHQQLDPLKNCNGEISHMLWVDNWPRPFSQTTASQAFRPTNSHYIGGAQEP